MNNLNFTTIRPLKSSFKGRGMCAFRTTMQELTLKSPFEGGIRGMFSKPKPSGDSV